jgi:hypothetical protein
VVEHQVIVRRKVGLEVPLERPHVQFRNGSTCCQTVYFQTKNTKLGKFWKVLQ